MKLDWTDLKLLTAVVFGVVMSMLLSTVRSWKAAAVCVLAGAGFAYFGTEPVIRRLGEVYALDGWPYVLAGLLAMTGDRLARRIMSLVDSLQVPPFLGGQK